VRLTAERIRSNRPSGTAGRFGNRAAFGRDVECGRLRPADDLHLDDPRTYEADASAVRRTARSVMARPSPLRGCTATCIIVCGFKKPKCLSSASSGTPDPESTTRINGFPATKAQGSLQGDLGTVSFTGVTRRVTHHIFNRAVEQTINAP